MISLREARNNKGLTQEDVARAAGVTLRYYARVEKAESVPTVTVAVKICTLLEENVHNITEWNR